MATITWLMLELLLIICYGITRSVEGAYMDVEGLGQVDSTFAEGSPCLSPADPEQRCFAGCKHIFMDLGSNIGMHARFLFEPDHYNNSRYSSLIFDKMFSSQKERTKACMIGWEPNPAHKDRLRRLSAYLKKKNFRADWIFAGVSSTNRNISFVHANTEMDLRNEEWGFSRVPHSPAKKKAPVRTTYEEIMAMDISLFIHQHIPNINKYDGKPHLTDPTIIMKMDVEAEEYRIVPKMIATGVYCRIRVLTVEWHGSKFTKENPSARIGRSENALKAVMWKIGRDELCKNTTVIDVDDESYVRDSKWGRYTLSGTDTASNTTSGK